MEDTLQVIGFLAALAAIGYAIALLICLFSIRRAVWQIVRRDAGQSQPDQLATVNEQLARQARQASPNY